MKIKKWIPQSFDNDDQPNTATEVLEKSEKASERLNETYGQLQKELLSPLIARSFKLMEPHLPVSGVHKAACEAYEKNATVD